MSIQAIFLIIFQKVFTFSLLSWFYIEWQKLIGGAFVGNAFVHNTELSQFYPKTSPIWVSVYKTLYCGFRSHTKKAKSLDIAFKVSGQHYLHLFMCIIHAACSIPLVYSLIAKHISLLSQSFFPTKKKLCTLFMVKLKIPFGRKPFASKYML